MNTPEGPISEATRRIAREVARAQATAADRHARALHRTPTALHPVLALHRPMPRQWPPWVECHGCDAGDYAEASPEWPCRTWTTAATPEEEPAVEAPRHPGRALMHFDPLSGAYQWVMMEHAAAHPWPPR